MIGTAYTNKELDKLINEYDHGSDEDRYLNILNCLENCPVFSFDCLVTSEYEGKVCYHVYTYLDKDMFQSNCYIRININDVIEMIESEERETGYKIDHIVVESAEGKEFSIAVNDLKQAKTD